MKIIKINLKKIKESDLDLIIGVLQAGGAIAYPTDTIYGLGCLASNEKAIKKINRIKKRQPNKGYIVLINSLAMAKKYAKINKSQEEFLKNIWPGPYTVVLPSRNKFSSLIENGGGVAMRWPKNNFLNEAITKTKLPLISTSVNISGSKNLIKPKEIIGAFKNKKLSLAPDLLVDGGITKRVKPSTLVDLRDISNIKILRP